MVPLGAEIAHRRQFATPNSLSEVSCNPHVSRSKSVAGWGVKNTVRTVLAMLAQQLAAHEI
jgi:hypothetical protein